MISDLDCAKLCDALYNDPSYPWDDLIQPEADNGICVGIRLIDGVRYIVFRGSETPQDWLRDGISEFFHTMPGFEALGDVALGFSEGMPELFRSKLELLTEAPWVSVGHSLGAARAQIMAGMGVVAGVPPLRCVGFGPPRVAMGAFTKAVAQIPFALYANSGDPVADVPTCPPFQHPRELISINVPAPPGDPWGPLAAHHLELYEKGFGG